MGFEKEEADISLQTCQPGLPLLDVGEAANRQPDPVLLKLAEKPDLSPLSEQDRASIVIEESAGAVIAKIAGLISAEAQAALMTRVEPENRAYATVVLQTHQATLERILAPVNKGEKFVIPQLCLRGENDQLVLPDGDFFLDAGQWTLTGPARLSDTEFSLHEDGKTFEIDIEDGHLHERFVSTSEQMNLALVDTGWTDLLLARNLDKKLRQRDISQPVLLEFIRRTIVYLIEERHIPLPALVRGRFLLQKVLDSKIRKLRAEARRRGYQSCLFANNAPVEVSFEFGLTFGPYDYEPRWMYPGRPYRFSKHFYPQVGELKNSGEEFECAKLLDIHPKVKYWVRNIERSPRSFRLATSTDYFYPDFVAMLTDGRTMIVEYKGALHDPVDVAEKESIGKLWEAKYEKRGLFLMAWNEREGCNTEQQIHKTIG
jgi:type III restriction enzyme